MASTIKVDNVQNQPGTNVVNKCGTTVNIGAASDNIRSAGNNLQASDGGNLISQCGTTITLGASGDTVALASGASQTGFGRTGTVDWQTGDIKTAAFIPAVGKGYFVNTTGGTITVNLPAGSAGDIVGLKDYAGTWDSNAVTLNPNGSEKIGGGSDLDPTLSSEGGAVLLVYVDGTQGWLTTQESVTSSPSGVETFVAATGGNQPTAGGCIVCTNYKQHTFTGPGTFCVSQIATCAADNAVAYLVVAGGASAGTAGGGAGGFREGFTTSVTPYTASPLAAACSGLTVTASPYSIVVGGGGAASTGIGNAGSVSSFSTIPSAGGGGGAQPGPSPGPAINGLPGGSGGGGAYDTPGSSSLNPGGTGNDPPTTPAQGRDGGSGEHVGPSHSTTGGGGGAGCEGAGVPSGTPGTGVGGNGVSTSITGSSVARGGGGGGAGVPGAGGTGGGGPKGPGTPGVPGNSGTVNTGGGGGGRCGPGPCSGAGGSGVVIIRYKFQ